MNRLTSLILTLFCSLALAAPKPLAMDQAFQLTGTARDAQTILLNWQVAPGYYLYRNHFKIKAVNQAESLSPPIYPFGATKKIVTGLGTYEVYKGNVQIIQPIAHASNKDVTLQIQYQGCSDAGFCYPPTSKVLSINLAGPYLQPVKPLAIDIAPQTNNTQEKTTSKTHPVLNPQNRIEQLLSSDNLTGIVIGFFIFGLLIAFTPCVLPMIPILSGIIIGKGKISHKHSFLLSVAYVFGMAITYAIAGMIFGFIGSSVQAWFQQTWLIVLFTLLFIAMALSLFGLYNLELPQGLRNKLAHLSDHQKPGTYFGVAVMGVFSTLVLSPCVTPPLVAVLAYVSAAGSAAIGAIALFVMGIGMGAPLLLIGAFGPKILPHTSKWMNTTKYIMGILMLAVAIWMISRILPDDITMLLWALLIIGIGIALGALSSSKGLAQHCRKAIALILFVYGIILAVGAFMGNGNLLEPLSHNTALHQNTLYWRPVKTVADVKKQLTLPKNQNKLVILDFYANWCVSCKEIEHFVFDDADVRSALKDVVLLRADVTKNTTADKALERHFGVVAPPTILFFGHNGKELKAARIVGAVSKNRFIHILSDAKDSISSP